MNKVSLIVILIAVVLAGILTVRFFSGSEDTWICSNGQWVKHGNPSAPMPIGSCK